MASGKAYVDWLKNKGQWGAKSPDNKKIMAVAAKINALKGQLTLDPKLSAIAKDKKKSSKGENKGKKFKNKNNSSNKKYQKKNEVWKKVPPKVNKKKTKEVGKFTFNWCEHHMASTSLLIALWARSTRKTRRKATTTKPTLLLLHPQPPPSTIATQPYWPLFQP
jgi:hypothetical protein